MKEYIGFEKQLMIIDHMLAGNIIDTNWIARELLVTNRTATRIINRMRDMDYMLKSIDLEYTEAIRGVKCASLKLKKSAKN